MKTIYIAIVAALVLAACSDDSDNSTTVNVNGKKLKRNTEINKTNAYNDLFLDSARLENFIAEQQLNDTVGPQLREFYYARNFEFAWFDSRGLNEQALAFRNLYDFNKDSAVKEKISTTRSIVLLPKNHSLYRSEMLKLPKRK